jgi:hypothetical protein
VYVSATRGDKRRTMKIRFMRSESFDFPSSFHEGVCLVELFLEGMADK